MPELEIAAPTKTPDFDPIARDLVTALRAKFETGDTKRYSWRLRQLDGLERFLTEREPEILDALSADLGKPTTEAWASEIGATLSDLRHTRKNLRSWLRPERVKTSKVAFPARSYVYREPLGVALIISPWNFPVNLLIAPLIGAVAAGNCVLLKPSEVSPHTAALFTRWLPKYVDDGAIKVMEGGVAETTALLAQKWDYIFYTGNGQVGRIVMGAAAKHLTPVTLELGGKSPCIVDKTANLDLAARRIVMGKFHNAGQMCVSPDYVLVEEQVHDALINRITATIREYYGDDPKKSPDLARIVNERHHARVSKLLDSGEIVVGGDTDVTERYIAPTVLKNVKESDPVMQEEIFGPILPVIAVPHIDAAISFVTRHDKPLALYIFSTDKRMQERIIARTSAGGTAINHVWIHLGVNTLPFGGVGESGMGAYHGRASFETFTHRRAVLKKPDLMEPPLLYPPYSSRKLRWLKRLV